MSEERFGQAGGPMTRALGKIDTKEIPFIIRLMPHKTLHFGPLAALSPLVTRKGIPKQLQQLIEDGLLSPVAYREILPRVNDALREKGQALWPMLSRSAEWTLALADEPMPIHEQ